MGFQKLSKIAEAKKTRLIMGLDPIEKEWVLAGSPSKLLYEYKEKIKMASTHVAGVKPNLAFYEGIDGGREVMAELIQYAHEEHGLTSVMDAKRGDIENTMKRFAKADKKNFNPDIVTVYGWSGSDSYLPYVDAGMSPFIINAMSGTNAKIQDLMCQDGLTVAQHVALDAHENGKGQVGLVIGANKLDAMKNIRNLEKTKGFKRLHVLSPGFGKQGASLGFVKIAGENAFYPISSGLTQPEHLNGMTTEHAAESWKNAINQQIDL